MGTEASVRRIGSLSYAVNRGEELGEGLSQLTLGELVQVRAAHCFTPYAVRSSDVTG